MSNGIMLSDMISLAVNSHSGQLDKAGMPYILHPLKVMHYLNTDDLQLMCIAIGHDLLEDTVVTFDEILNITSVRIIQGIVDLTRIIGETERHYRDKVLSNYDAMLVKLADLKHNMDITRLKKGISKKDLTRLERYREFHEEIKNKLNSMLPVNIIQ